MNMSWDGLDQGFADQRDFCKDCSPLYEALFGYCATIAGKKAAGKALGTEGEAFVTLLESKWAERSLRNGTEAGLLLAAAIHASVLKRDPEAEAISRFYATCGGSYAPKKDHDAFVQTLGKLFVNPGPAMRCYLRSGQLRTNEISRGAIWLIPALVMSHCDGEMPITLVDLGCSAGLNLLADLQTWVWDVEDGDRTLNITDGEPPLVTQYLNFGIESTAIKYMKPGPQQPPHIAKRLGLDLHPAHLDDPEDVVSLRACIWGDQPERLARLDQALKLVGMQPEMREVDVIKMARALHTELTTETRLLLVYNSALTMYMTDEEFATLHENITETFKRLPKTVEGMWVELEPPRHGEPDAPDEHRFPIKAHKLREGRLLVHYLGYTEPHPKHIVLLPGWSEVIGAE